jgi:hypothetical protein
LNLVIFAKRPTTVLCDVWELEIHPPETIANSNTKDEDKRSSNKKLHSFNFNLL